MPLLTRPWTPWKPSTTLSSCGIVRVCFRVRRSAAAGCYLAGATSVSPEARDQVSPARRRVELRRKEGRRRDSLFQDPYAALLALPPVSLDNAPSGEADEPSDGYYEVATRFLDDVLLAVANNAGSKIRQVVLLTDGIDTRPYRLPWPPSTVLFDVSPGDIHKATAICLKEAKVKPPRGCLLRHVSADVAFEDDCQGEGWEERLQQTAYRGDRASLWALQGLDNLTPGGLQGILGHVGSLAKLGSVFIGEIPWAAVSATSMEEASTNLKSVFARNGFLAQPIQHCHVAEDLGRPLDPELAKFHQLLLFTAEQKRLSVAESEMAAAEIGRAEGEGDEDGFDDIY